MKKLLFIILLLVSCDKEDEDTNSGVGCLTGYSKTTKKLELIRCCTYKEYTAGSNTSAGGTSSFENYTGHNWKAVNDCSECR